MDSAKSQPVIYEEKIKEFKNKILGFNRLDNNIDSLTAAILDLEQKILSFGPPHYKEAPSNSITTRHEYYNLLDLIPDRLAGVSKKIVSTSRELIGGDEFYVKMWANIFRNGECIKRHMHHASPIIENDMFKQNVFKTICGNLFLFGDAPSDTIYHGEEKIIINNIPGDIYFFSCILEHETFPYQGTLRVGIAFDIYTKNFFPELGMTTPSNLRLIS